MNKMKCAYKIGLTGIDVATVSLQVSKENVEEILTVLKEKKHKGDERIKNLSETNGCCYDWFSQVCMWI